MNAGGRIQGCIPKFKASIAPWRRLGRHSQIVQRAQKLVRERLMPPHDAAGA